jgi:hypothetical protein
VPFTFFAERRERLRHQYGEEEALSSQERGRRSPYKSMKCIRSLYEGDFFLLFVLLCGKVAHTVPNERKATWELL